MPLHFLLDVCHAVHLFYYSMFGIPPMCHLSCGVESSGSMLGNRIPRHPFLPVERKTAQWCLHDRISDRLPLSCWTFCVNEKNIGVDIPAWGPSHLPAGGGQNLFRTLASRSVLFHCFLFSFLCFISSVVLVRTGGDFGLFSNLLHVPDIGVPADSYAGLFQTLSETFGEMSCPSPSSHCDGGARRRGTRQPGQTPSMQVAIQTHPKPDEAIELAGGRPCDRRRNKYFTLTELRWHPSSEQYTQHVTALRKGEVRCTSVDRAPIYDALNTKCSVYPHACCVVPNFVFHVICYYDFVFFFFPVDSSQ